ncbi:MAG: cysteine--tRNA ligase [Lentisphaerae bacterium]|nr:cysteine--tRNA ligase [Victivallaceae bacterium]MDD3117191.1 cysteine--tRNA ligase [Victivallaceae bacterium]NLK84228.1 cysteine--tRNA ligase [Lentisphaerota bacterium]
MTIKFFNTLGRRLEEFKPVNAGEARMYTCGPTVYNYAHIGNFRAYVFEDLLRRTLKYFGYKVTQVMNLTDVDDKTIRDSRKQKMSLNDFTAIYKQAFFEDLKTLRIEPAEFYPAATDHINEMIAIIRSLLDQGFAYQAEDRSIYFSIAKFPDYGKLAKIDMENQRSGVRIKTDEYAKDSVADFALWKAWDENDGEVKWDSPWGPGRPGWHIECSAMSMKYLGKTFDIHTGGIDNMFPHHEDEIAQSEAANSCRYVNFWLHCEHLIINGEKMSKSAGNFFTLREMVEKGFNGREIRWVLLSAHYRKKLNFTFEACEQARMQLRRFSDFFMRLKELKQNGVASPQFAETLRQAADSFKAALGDDLNISEAFAVLFSLQREINRLLDENQINRADADAALELFRNFDTVLALLDVDAAAEGKVPAQILELAEKRRNARNTKDFAAADAIRDELKNLGWMVEDAPDGGFRCKPL